MEVVLTQVHYFPLWPTRSYLRLVYTGPGRGAAERREWAHLFQTARSSDARVGRVSARGRSLAALGRRFGCGQRLWGCEGVYGRSNVRASCGLLRKQKRVDEHPPPIHSSLEGVKEGCVREFASFESAFRESRNGFQRESMRAVDNPWKNQTP